jgi:hypothetical protein
MHSCHTPYASNLREAPTPMQKPALFGDLASEAADCDERRLVALEHCRNNRLEESTVRGKLLTWF